MFFRNWAPLPGAVISVFAAMVLGAAPAGADPVLGPLPVPFNPNSAMANAIDALTPPPGANLVNCRASKPGRNPVVLVNGMYLTQGSTWASGAPYLRNNGYCVYTFNYGNPLPAVAATPIQQITDMRASGRELAAQVERVRGMTGAAKVDLIGYSEGGVLAQYFVNVLGGASKVANLVTIVGENHGMHESPVPAPLDKLMPPMTQLRTGSDFINEVYRGGDTRPGVKYTVITSSADPIVAPYQNTFLRGPEVANILLQEGCAADATNHNAAPHSKRVWWHVSNALDQSAATPVPCFAVPPA